MDARFQVSGVPQHQAGRPLSPDPFQHFLSLAASPRLSQRRVSYRETGFPPRAISTFAGLRVKTQSRLFLLLRELGQP